MTQDEFSRMAAVWLHRGTWTPQQAARLFAEQDPVRPSNVYEDAPETGLARHILDLMLSFPECRNERTPHAWIDWALRTGQHLNSALSRTPVVTASASDGSDQTPDPERRLDLLRALGGTSKYARGEWKFTGIGALVESEKAKGQKRSDAKTIRADLKDAAQTERDAKSAGFGSGLGKL